MMRAHEFLGLAALITGAIGGCDATYITPPDGGVFVFDGAMIVAPTDAGRDARGTDVRPDTGVPVGSPRRPDVPYENTATGANGMVTMDAWNLLQTDSTTYEELVVIFRNDSDVTLCGGYFNVAFLDDSGTLLGSIDGNVDGMPLESFGVALDCIVPGFQGIGWGNSSRVTRLADVRSIDLRFDGLVSREALPFAFVYRDSQEIYDPAGGGSYSALRGTYRITSGVVETPEVIIVPRDDAGLPLARITDIQLGTFHAGWAFATTWYRGTFEEFYEVTSYRNGASIVVDSPGARAAYEHRERARAIRAETEARRPLRPR